MTTRIVLSGLLTISAPTAAFAHAGHIGELAGHAHWVGIAALAGAAAIAGVAAWAGRKTDQADGEEEAADQDHGETAEEAV
ncbi:DUF6732 family protein [Roseibium sp.]|uniref:DUF6732 family protein n=1 Tax=Roseibium sp. TaxID=1936156 RepID=UPI003B529FA3